MFVGIDVGATRLHVVTLDAAGAVVGAEVLPVDATPSGDLVAIDAPAAPSTAPHRDDEALGRKFRTARGGEVALGRSYGVWVAWVPPVDGPAAPWMQVGFDLFTRIPDAVEVYPYGAFRVLAGARLPKKTTADGKSARLALLAACGVTGLDPSWSHDLVDAAVCALVASDVAAGTARAARCDHDGSAIWLPGMRSGMGLFDKIKGAVEKNADKVEDGIEKAADLVDDKTGGKYSDKIGKAADKAKSAVDKMGEEADRDRGSGPPGPSQL